MSANRNEAADDDQVFKPDPPMKAGFYQILALFIYHVSLAILLAYAVYNIWPPQPWPGDKAKPVTNSNPVERPRAVREANKNTTAANGLNVNSQAVSNDNSRAVGNSNAGTSASANSTTNTNTADKPSGSNEPGDTVEAALSSYPDEYPPPFWLFGRKFQPSLETRLILLVLLAGAIGSYVHAASSLVDYLGNRTFISSWMWWYLLRPFIGMMLALIFYFVFRGGFITAGVNQGGDAAASFINPFGVAAVAGLVGMFSKIAADKLNEVFQILFKSGSGEGDAKRRDKLSATPTVTALSVTPNIGPVGGGTPVTITGSGFLEGAKVTFGNIAATAVLVSSPTSLTAITPPHAAGIVDIEVTNTNNQKGVLKGGYTYQ